MEYNSNYWKLQGTIKNLKEKINLMFFVDIVKFTILTYKIRKYLNKK